MTGVPDPNIGRELGGRYTIISHLGGGGFGQTYLAEDKHLPYNPQCVVKHLKPRLMDDLSALTAKRLFETEAQVLYRLGHCDRIPRLLAHFEEHQEFYLVQEFINGHSLNCEIVTGICFPEAQVVALLRDILDVLEFVHQQNVIHRDIKPSNLIRRQADGKIVLIDFGAVKQLGAQVVNVKSHTTWTIAIGSPGYMPNEQLAGKPRFCSDIYAVGMIGIQALTGIHPKALPEDPITGEVHWRDRVQASSVLCDILDRMVRYDFRQRYDNTSEILKEISILALRYPASTYSFRRLGNSGDDETLTTLPTSQVFLDSDRSIDYRPLQDILKSGDWQAADRETQKLLLKVGDRQHFDQLTLEDIHCLSCRDLRTLDYLWGRYSNGRFGFSVQKQLWQTVSGASNPSYESFDILGKSNRSGWRVNTPIERFGRRVGWQAKHRWRLYDTLNFSLDAPEGHLPAWHLGAIGQGGQMVAFFARLDECVL